MDLSIIIVTFNSSVYIKKCLESVSENLIKSKKHEIIIVDNSSDDGTVKIVNAMKNDFIRVILNSSNDGYSKSVNQGIKEAAFENILVLNPDTIICQNAISYLLTALSLDNIGVVGPKLINKNGSFQLSSRRHFLTFSILAMHILKLNKLFPNSRLFGKYNYTFVDSEVTLDVDSTSGACMMFTKRVFNVIDGFDELFFMYFEDTDFCTRVKEKGYRVLYYPSAKIIHLNTYSDNYNSKMTYFYDSFCKFIYKYKYKIYLGGGIVLLAQLIRHFSYLKRIIYFNYNYKINNE